MDGVARPDVVRRGEVQKGRMYRQVGEWEALGENGKREAGEREIGTRGRIRSAASSEKCRSAASRAREDVPWIFSTAALDQATKPPLRPQPGFPGLGEGQGVGCERDGVLRLHRDSQNRNGPHSLQQLAADSQRTGVPDLTSQSVHTGPKGPPPNLGLLRPLCIALRPSHQRIASTNSRNACSQRLPARERAA